MLENPGDFNEVGRGPEREGAGAFGGSFQCSSAIKKKALMFPFGIVIYVEVSGGYLTLAKE